MSRLYSIPIMIFDLVPFIKTAGYIGVGSIIFAESGLFIGFFLPGDSLLFTAGLLASQHYLNIFLLVIITFFAAVIGDSVGYAFGKKVGPKLFNKPQSLLFNPKHIIKAKAFFEHHGAKAIILARFMPIIRTFAPITAGIGGMPYRQFLINNLVGGALWTGGVSLAGYYLGKVVPNVDHYLLPIILLIIILSFLPALFHIFKRDKKE